MRFFELIVPLSLAAGIGIALANQAAINSQLRQMLNSPLQAAFASFLVGTLFLACLVLLDSNERPSLQQISQIPWWLWIGGMLGVYAVTITIYAAPKLGFLTFTGVMLAGQIAMSMLLDKFGLLGVEKTALNWQRIFGTILIVLGVVFTLQR